MVVNLLLSASVAQPLATQQEYPPFPSCFLLLPSPSLFIILPLPNLPATEQSISQAIEQLSDRAMGCPSDELVEYRETNNNEHLKQRKNIYIYINIYIRMYLFYFAFPFLRDNDKGQYITYSPLLHLELSRECRKCLHSLAHSRITNGLSPR